jgi:hypothetical protein
MLYSLAPCRDHTLRNAKAVRNEFASQRVQAQQAVEDSASEANAFGAVFYSHSCSALLAGLSYATVSMTGLRVEACH